VQDVLLVAWQRRGGFRGEASVTTWLTAIAVRRVHNHARWMRVRRRMWPFAGAEDAQPAASSGCAVEAGDEVATMRRALARLRHGDREVLVLHYLEQRAVAEVAALLGCRRNAVEQRLARARVRLRSLLEERP
jgi:RNA polymerase sigma-70 factor (ECF subfamily)